MQQIKDMINSIIRAEGGYVNHPNDHGGPTKYGITIGTLGKWRARVCTEEDVRQLQQNEAYEIYYADYYQRSNIDNMPVEYQPFILDCVINHGIKGGVKLLQRELLEQGNPLLVDGICGQRTLECTWSIFNKRGLNFLNDMILRRKKLYRLIARNNPNQAVFLTGWLVRAESFRQENIA